MLTYGFNYVISNPQVKSKTFYHLTFPKHPDKSTVNQSMQKCKEIAEFKNMPFIQLVGDQPVFTLISEVKYENPIKYEKILPVLGSFHIQLAFMGTINKRFSGSGLSDLVVAAELIQCGSVDHALKGKHYSTGMR